MVPVSRWGHTKFFLKAVTEIILIGIAAFIADFFQRKISLGKISAGIFNPHTCNSITDALPGYFFEKCAKISWRDISMLGDIIKAKTAMFKIFFYDKGYSFLLSGKLYEKYYYVGRKGLFGSI